MSGSWSDILDIALGTKGIGGSLYKTTQQIGAGFNRTRSSSSTPWYLSAPQPYEKLNLPAPRRAAMPQYNIYGDMIPDSGNGGYAPRRRRRGITARDLASFRRVANLIRKYSAPVRHFRKHPKR